MKQKLNNAIIWCVLLSAVTIAVSQQPSSLFSEGEIRNTGTIKIRGDAQFTQDSIGGIVRYERNYAADSQLVAQLTYANVHFEGKSRKMILSPLRPLVADSLFWSLDSSVTFTLIPDTWIQANRTVVHDGHINPGARYGRFVLRGTELQDVSGTGSIPIVELDNNAGARITHGGGLQVVERLDLQHGRLDNSATDNIAMLNQSWLWRDDSGSIAMEPAWDTRMHLRYYGDSAMRGGPEMIRNSSAIGHLVNDDVAGLSLPYSITVNDSLILRGHIFTEPDTGKRYELRYASVNDPDFKGMWPEVNGTMVRTTLVDGKTMVMNNRFTSIKFDDAAGRGTVVQYAIRSKPKTVPEPLTDITYKVDRYLQLEARDANGDRVADSTYMLTIGYAWRNKEIDGLETPQVVETIPQLVGQETQLVLMRYNGLSYNPYGFSQLPTTATSNPMEAWRFSTAGMVRASGDFAIGLSTGPIWVLNTRLLLEGPIRTYGEYFTPVMAADLAAAGRIPTMAPAVYPYTLDPKRLTDTAIVIGDSIVDWVTVEYRKTPTGSGPAELVQNLLLTTTGAVLDPRTLRPPIVEGIDAGLYNLVFRHRNHLAVVTEDKVVVDRSNLGFVLDLTTGTGLLGGAAAEKLVGTSSGRRFFALIAGEVEGADEIARSDYNLIWGTRNLEGYLLTDTDLNGIVTTRDANVSWNNRGRLSVAPR